MLAGRMNADAGLRQCRAHQKAVKLLLKGLRIITVWRLAPEIVLHKAEFAKCPLPSIIYGRELLCQAQSHPVMYVVIL